MLQEPQPAMNAVLVDLDSRRLSVKADNQCLSFIVKVTWHARASQSSHGDQDPESFQKSRTSPQCQGAKP